MKSYNQVVNKLVMDVITHLIECNSTDTGVNQYQIENEEEENKIRKRQINILLLKIFGDI